MITADQSAALEFLSRPTSYPARPERVERIDTHAAVAFLAGDRAYKVKRAVQYDYLDFSTLERRKVACEAELRINRRTAPGLYLGVEPLARGQDGVLRWGSSGAIVEWVLVMQRFAQDALFDRLATAGALDLALMGPLGDAIARFHDAAERVHTHGGRHGMNWVIEGNAQAFAEHAATLGADACATVTALCRDALARNGDLLDTRRLGGFVRRCHGDLHLRNIVLLHGEPTLFDAVEFNDEISCVDVLYDLAFLLMDLRRRQLPEHANAVFNRYLSSTADLAGLPLLPFFLACRAAIRAKTSATAASLQAVDARADELRTLARDYLTMADRLLRPPPPVLVAIGGFSGSGKSTLAARLAPRIGPAPGALLLRSDVIRKSLFGVSERSRLGPEGYGAETTQKVYSLLAERASLALAGGHAVITDAVYSDAHAREMIARVASRLGAPFFGLWLEADLNTLGRRLDARIADASDATRAVLDRQVQAPTGPISWFRIDTTGGRDEAARRAHRAMRTIVQASGPE